MTNRLADKITVITGATSGIGEATARRFIEEGATVVLAGRSRTRARRWPTNWASAPCSSAPTS